MTRRTSPASPPTPDSLPPCESHTKLQTKPRHTLGADSHPVFWMFYHSSICRTGVSTPSPSRTVLSSRSFFHRWGNEGSGRGACLPDVFEHRCCLSSSLSDIPPGTGGQPGSHHSVGGFSRGSSTPVAEPCPVQGLLQALWGEVGGCLRPPATFYYTMYCMPYPAQVHQPTLQARDPATVGLRSAL